MITENMSTNRSPLSCGRTSSRYQWLNKRKNSYNKTEIILVSKTAAAEISRSRIGLTKKNISSISQQFPKEFHICPTIIVGKLPQDYLFEDTTYKECIVCRSRKLRRDHIHQNIEVTPHDTTIGELQYICTSQKNEIRQLYK